MNKIQHLSQISKNNGKYFFHYELAERKTVQFAMPVFTNANSMTNKIGTSKVYKKLVLVDKEVDVNETEEVDKETAELIYNMAKVGNMVRSVEKYESVNGWTVTLK